MLGRTNTGGGGGAGLNFAVKAYASEEVLLASTAKENTIGIVTNAISEWCFSVTEPESPVENMVWIQVGNASAVEFNALKKNAMYVYPVWCMQYVSGEYVDVFAYIYQGGEWVQFSRIITELYLYDHGNDCADVTGGWRTYGSGMVSYGADKMTVTVPGKYKNGGIATKNAIDVSAYSSLAIDWSGQTSDYVIALRKDGTTVKVVSLSDESSVSIEDITGECIIEIHCRESYTSGRSVQIYALWLEGGGGSASTANVTTFALTRDTSTPVQTEIDGTTYGIENATLNQDPTESTYDFTVL